MNIQLKELKPNPYRDFVIDPIDPENVRALTESIREHGFWGGVVCREVNGGTIQIAAGHHRIEAALKAGLRSADLFIGDLDDSAMILAYTTENATQRGNSGTAIAGSIASVARFLIKQFLVGSDVARNLATSQKTFETIRGQIGSAKGLGHAIIEKFLKGVPGVTTYVVQQQLATLEASGDYARIVREVTKEIENEQRAAVAELERLERESKQASEQAEKAKQDRIAATARAKAAAEKADRAAAEVEAKRAEAERKLAQQRKEETEKELEKFAGLITGRKAVASLNDSEPTFDFEGISKHLRNENQIRIFREVVTGKGVQPFLDITKQAALAAELVRVSKETGHELSGAFIRDHVISLIVGVKSFQRKLSDEERANLEVLDIRSKFDRLQHDFARNVRGMYSAGIEMLALMKQHRTITFTIGNEFRTTLATAKSVITQLTTKL